MNLAMWAQNLHALFDPNVLFIPFFLFSCLFSAPTEFNFKKGPERDLRISEKGTKRDLSHQGKGTFQGGQNVRKKNRTKVQKPY